MLMMVVGGSRWECRLGRVVALNMRPGDSGGDIVLDI